MIAHELTGRYGLDHARTLAIILPAILKVRSEAKHAKLLQYAERVWHISQGSDAEKIAQAIARTEAFFQQLGMPIRLSHADIPASDFPLLLQNLEKHGMTRLGERGDVDLTVSAAILHAAA